MRPFWHPLSALLDPGLGTFSSPALIRMPLQLGATVELLYAGDRMWPAVRHGDRFELESCRAAELRLGEVVAVERSDGPEVARLVGVAADRLMLQGDAEPGDPWRADVGTLLGRAGLTRMNGVGRRRRDWRRLRIDLAEAWRQPGRSASEDADSVRRKYDVQAAHYAALDEGLDPPLLSRLNETPGKGGRVVVAGSGSGRECFALARAGFSVRGLDFAEQMVRQARAGAERRRLQLEFAQADLRRHVEPPGSVGAVLFTYDVYSFLPDPADRVQMLRRMRGWLAPGGIVLLSARRVFRAYDRGILSLQRLRSGRPWGGSHTRYVTADGKLRRSFVHYFTHSALRREIEAAGLRPGAWRGGHVELSAP